MATTKKPAAKKTRAARKPAPRKTGRPTSYTEQIAEAICEGIASGKSAKEVCKSLGVNEGTLYEWLKKDAGFQERYALARERQADLLAAEILEIADEAEVEVRHQGEEVTLDISSAAVQRNRLRVDARKWYASKLAPKKYGDKLAIGGAEDLPPVAQQVAYQMDDAALMAIAAGTKT